MNNLMALSEASDVVQQVQELQRQLTQIQDMLHANQPVDKSPRGATSKNGPPDATSRLVGLTWAEEMDERDPPDEEVDPSSSVTPAPRALRKVSEVSERTKQHLVRSFACMDNKEWRCLTDLFALPKVAVTKTLELDKIMVAQCSKSTKSNDQALARIQTLNSDTLAPLTELLEMLNKEDSEITFDQVGYAVESAITLLGNAFAQMSMLRRQRVRTTRIY